MSSMGRKHGPPRRVLAQILVFGIVVILVAAISFAQSTTSTIRGQVQNDQGDPVSGADIVATNVDTGFTAIAASKENGNFILPGLTPGRYTILVASPAYSQTTTERTLLVGQTIDLVFRMAPSTVLTEAITVVGDQFVDTKTSEVATNVTRQQIENLPQNDRNFLNFAALAPGVLLGNDEFRKEVKAGAQGSSAVNVYIDGVSFKNDVIQGGVVGQDSSRGNPFPQNAVQEFRVVSQNYSAEYAKASSAVITAITKSGSNKLSGDAFFFYQNKDMVAENPLTGADPEYKRNQWGVSIGGPIVQDKLHFFGSWESNDQDRENTVTLGGGFQAYPELRAQLAQYQGTFVSPFREDLGFGKISYQPNQHQVLDVSTSYRRETDIRSFGGQTSREAAENVKNDTWSITGRHNYTWQSAFNELTLAYQDFQWNPQPLNPDQVGLVYENLLQIGGRDTEQKIGQKRTSVRDDVTFANIGPGGAHTVKTGAVVEFLDYTVTKFFEENPRYFFREDMNPTIPYKARIGFGDPDLSANNTEYGVFVQDDWAVNQNLLLNLGLRWDYETDMLDTNYVTPADVRARLGDQFPAKYFSDGNDRSPKSDMFQPRLGFSYDVNADGKTVVFGGAGRYYDRNLFNNTLDEKFRLQHVVGEFFFSENGDPVFGQPAVKWDPKYLTAQGLRELQAMGITGKPEVFLVENNTQVPYSDQLNLGVRRSFGNMVAAISYANTRSYHGFSYLWGAGFCCPQFDPAYSNVLISSDDIKTWYDAVYITLDRPFTADSNYGYNLVYTWNNAEQIGGDLFSLDLPTIADWPRYGTPGTSENRIVANGIVGLPWDVRLSAILQYSSGDRCRIHDRTAGFCSTCYVPRTGEGPSWTTIDLAANKDFQVGPTRLGIILQAFNVTNAKRYAFFNDFIGPDGNPNLGKPTGLVGNSQRRFQVGLRVGF